MSCLSDAVNNKSLINFFCLSNKFCTYRCCELCLKGLVTNIFFHFIYCLNPLQWFFYCLNPKQWFSENRICRWLISRYVIAAMLMDGNERSLISTLHRCHLFLKKCCKQPIRYLYIGTCSEGFPRKNLSLGGEKKSKKIYPKKQCPEMPLNRCTLF